MATIMEINERLDGLYKDYINNKNQLNGSKTQEAARLLVDMTLAKEVNPEDIAVQLAKFSADITKVYFESLTKSGTFPIEALDDVLKEFLETDKDAKKSQYYVQKFVFAVTTIMKNYKEKALQSAQLPRLVIFISKFAVRSDKNKEKFQKLINNTTGGIYLLDYSGTNRNSLTNIWNVTNTLYPELSKAKYEEFITEWAKKYGFIAEAAKTEPSAEKTAESEKEPQVITTEPTASVSADAVENKTVSGKSGNITAELVESLTKKLYFDIKKELSDEKEAVISAFRESIAPLSETVVSFRTEVKQNQELSAANTRLHSRISGLEQQINELHQRIQETEKTVTALRTERDALAEKAAKLEAANAEAEEKLKEAYTINSREASLEAEKVRADLTKAFGFLYEDWLDYEFSDVSEDNYESLQAIIKKVFRSLERNGINFKGNHE